MAFTFEEQKIPGVFVITPQVFGDSRGYFAETYKASDQEASDHHDYGERHIRTDCFIDH